MELIRINDFSTEILQLVSKYVQQLTNGTTNLSAEYFQTVLNSENTHLLLLYNDDKKVVGMITLVLCIAVSGNKGWIEDVVVDYDYRGKGYGKLLVDCAIEYAKSLGVDTLMLTSNPSRIEANKLYQSIGFEQYITNVYKLKM